MLCEQDLVYGDGQSDILPAHLHNSTAPDT